MAVRYAALDFPVVSRRREIQGKESSAIELINTRRRKAEMRATEIREGLGGWRR